MRVQSWQKGMKTKKRASYLAFGLSSAAGARGLHGKSFFQKSTQTIAREKSLQISSIGKREAEWKGEREREKEKTGAHNYLYSDAQYGFLQLPNAHTHTHTPKGKQHGAQVSRLQKKEKKNYYYY